MQQLFIAVLLIAGVFLLSPPGAVGKRTRGVLAAVVTVTAGVFLALAAPSVAHAAADDGSGFSLELNASLVTMIVAYLIPLLTGLITKIDTTAMWKGLVTLVLNLVSAAIVTATVADGTAVWSTETLLTALGGFAVSIVSYLGLFKPVAINGKLVPDKGLPLPTG